MLPLLRVQHHQSYGYRLFLSLKTLLGVRHVVIGQALLGYVIFEYSLGFSHADRLSAFNKSTEKKGEVSVMLRQTCCCSTSTYFQEVDRRETRTATLSRLWSRVPCCCHYRCFFTVCCTSSSYFQEVVWTTFFSFCKNYLCCSTSAYLQGVDRRLLFFSGHRT